jgi:hypothetical protein
MKVIVTWIERSYQVRHRKRRLVKVTPLEYEASETHDDALIASQSCGEKLACLAVICFW